MGRLEFLVAHISRVPPEKSQILVCAGFRISHSFPLEKIMACRGDVVSLTSFEDVTTPSEFIMRSNRMSGDAGNYGCNLDIMGPSEYSLRAMMPPKGYEFLNGENIDDFMWSYKACIGRYDSILHIMRRTERGAETRFVCRLCRRILLLLHGCVVDGSDICNCCPEVNQQTTAKGVYSIKYECPQLGLYSVYNYLMRLSKKTPLGITMTYSKSHYASMWPDRREVRVRFILLYANEMYLI